MKGKDKGRKVATHASFQVSIRSFTKASIQRIVVPTTTIVGSPTPTPSPLAPDHVAAPSHSSATIPLVLRKKKAIVLDTSVTSSKRPFTLSLI